QPQELHRAAAKALAGFAYADVTPTVRAAWRGYTPALRSEVVELLLARLDRILPVLDAVAAWTISSTQISSARRALLLKSTDPAIRERSLRLLGKDAPSPRKEVIEQYKPALALAADRLRGKQVFERECIGCHRLEDKG